LIKDNIVLILGAGASAPYGFPSGQKLLIEIYHTLSKEGSILWNQFILCGHTKEKISEFRNDLYLSNQPSVDAFLERNIEYIDIGKDAIAATLLPYERKGELFRRENETHFYQFLFNKMDENDPEKFKENKVAFITFNYDRSLEYYLFKSLKHSHRLKEEKAAEITKSIPIIHVHGKLGELQYFSSEPIPYDSFKDNDTVDHKIIKKGASGIKIIHEVNDITEELSVAHKLIKEAKRIYFLGFGYHPTNIERIMKGFKDVNHSIGRISGTAYGLEDGEKKYINQMFLNYNAKGIKLGGINEDALMFLKKNYIF